MRTTHTSPCCPPPGVKCHDIASFHAALLCFPSRNAGAFAFGESAVVVPTGTIVSVIGLGSEPSNTCSPPVTNFGVSTLLSERTGTVLFALVCGRRLDAALSNWSHLDVLHATESAVVV